MSTRGKTNDHHQVDPMREIDLMILEDVMHRDKVETTATAIALRTSALKLALTRVVHTIVYRNGG